MIAWDDLSLGASCHADLEHEGASAIPACKCSPRRNRARGSLGHPSMQVLTTAQPHRSAQVRRSRARDRELGARAAHAPVGSSAPAARAPVLGAAAAQPFLHATSGRTATPAARQRHCDGRRGCGGSNQAGGRGGDGGTRRDGRGGGPRRSGAPASGTGRHIRRHGRCASWQPWRRR